MKLKAFCKRNSIAMTSLRIIELENIEAYNAVKDIRIEEIIIADKGKDNKFNVYCIECSYEDKKIIESYGSKLRFLTDLVFTPYYKIEGNWVYFIS